MPVCPCTSFSRFLSPYSPPPPPSFVHFFSLPCLAFPPLSLFAKRVSFRRLSVSISSSHSILLYLFLPVVLHPLTRLFLEPLSPSLSLSLPSSVPLASPYPCSVFFLSAVNLLRLSYREIPTMIIRWKFHADEHPSADTFMLLVASCHALITLFVRFVPPVSNWGAAIASFSIV